MKAGARRGWLLLPVAFVLSCGASVSDRAAVSDVRSPPERTRPAGEPLPFPGRSVPDARPISPQPLPEALIERSLSDSEIKELLDLVKPINEGEQGTGFSLPPATRQPRDERRIERKGLVAEGSELAPAAVEAHGPPRIARFGPEGEVTLAGQISLTFDRPMVAVSDHAGLAGQAAAIELTPGVPGRWRWLGTRTLLFEPDGERLPMATDFTVTVPAGLEDAFGNRSDESVRWSFSTPPPQLVQRYPRGAGVARQPLLLLGFDQRVDAGRVRDHARLIDARGNEQALRLAGAEEIEADRAVKRRLQRLDSERVVVLRPEARLRGDTPWTLALPAGLEGLEGPRTTETRQQFGFQTFGPMRLTGVECGADCPPESPVRLRFSVAPDPDQDFESLIAVEPEIPGLVIEARNREVVLAGLKQGSTDYRIAIDRALADVHGQMISGRREYRFRTGPATARLLDVPDGLVTLDPDDPGALDIGHVNLAAADIRIHRVRPEHWTGFHEAARSGEEIPELPGEPVLDRRVALDGERDRPSVHRLDLSGWLDDGRGHLVLTIDAVHAIEGAESTRFRPRHAWLQATAIGLDAWSDHDEMVVWTTDLASGRPSPGVRVMPGHGGRERRSDDEGLVRLALPETDAGRDAPQWLVAADGEDSAILAARRGTAWRKQAQPDGISWFVFDDRGIYQPGERVHLKGWLRRIERRPQGGLMLPEDGGRVTWRVVDARGNTVGKGRTGVSAGGGFDLAFDLPGDVNSGRSRVALSFRDEQGEERGRHQHGFRIEQFRRPEFEVEVSMPETAPVAGERLHAGVAANWYVGGPLAAGETRWRLQARPGHYRPPGHDGWQFGDQDNVWLPRPVGPPRRESEILEDHGRTGADGRHGIAVELDSAFDPPVARVISARVEVTDVNRQSVSGSVQTLVHAATAYVGMRTENHFVDAGRPLEVALAAVDIEGKALAGREIEVTAGRLDGPWHRSGEAAQLRDVRRCTVASDSGGRARCRFGQPGGGRWQLTARIVDDQGRVNRTRILRWVGGSPVRPLNEQVRVEQLDLVADRDEYAPGDLARVLVQSPIKRAEGLLVLTREGVADVRRFSLDDGSATLEIPLRHDWVPNIRARVLLLGEQPRETVTGNRPVLAGNEINLPLSPARRELKVRAGAESSGVAPGATSGIEISVRDHENRPVAGAEVALVVVDEAVLAVSGYEPADPMAVFYRHRPGRVQSRHQRPDIRLLLAPGATPATGYAGYPLTLAVEESRTMRADDGTAADTAPALTSRSDFNPLAAFEPALVTDADGRAHVEIELPDNLTRYRIMAVAVADSHRYGRGESTLTARQPLMLRPSPPRFANFGDRFDLPLVVHNRTGSDRPIAVAMATRNLDLTGPAGVLARIPAGERAEIRLPVATRRAGTARWQAVAQLGAARDAVRGEFEVWTPATREAFATYGSLTDVAVAYPVDPPEDIWPQYGGLEITTSASALHGLIDAWRHLYDYPFESSEAIASRLLAIAALGDVLDQFADAGLPSPEAIDQRVAEDLEILARRQHAAGGFGNWHRGDRLDPYLGVHVTHALVRLNEAGHAVNGAMLENALAFAGRVDQHLNDDYSRWPRLQTLAYALHVRRLAGDDRAAAGAGELLDSYPELDEWPLAGIGWLLAVLSADEAGDEQQSRLLRFIDNRVVETAAGAQIADPGESDGYLVYASDRLADAVITDALLSARPETDLVGKLVNQLQAARSRGRWAGTHLNAFVILALNHYFREFEAEEPDFVMRAWLDDRLAGEGEFAGRSAPVHHRQIPMAWLAESGRPHELVLARDGTGRGYYRIGLDYAPLSLELEPAAHGFEVERRWLALEDDDDVRRGEDGVWTIRAGARVAVEVTLATPATRHHVALVDPLAAGLEARNPALETVAEPEAGIDRRWWWRWFDHQNLRHDRAEAFARRLSGGVYRYRYTLRATTPGEFVVPPARAEEMYNPETFGRSSSDRLRIESRD